MRRFVSRGRIQRKKEEESVQPKMEVGEPGDKKEKEADAVADKVMKMPDSGDQSVRMQPAEEEEAMQAQAEEEESVQMQEEEEAVQMRPESESVQMQPMEEEEESMQMQEEEEEAMQMQEEEEESMQMQEEEEAAQMKEDEEVSMQEEEEESMQMQEEEESAQMQEEEEAAQMKEDEEVSMQEEESVQAKEEEEVQKQEEEEEEIMPKTEDSPAIQREADGATYAAPSVAQQVRGSKGAGRPMDPGVQQDLGGKMGADFSGVRIHNDPRAQKLNHQLGAKAFTHGQDIYFSKGRYRPEDATGKRLLAHELTHVIQQNSSVQKGINKAPGPWRYTPPSKVTRSIKAIQGIVGTTPDGVYGPKTRDAVKTYQKRLKAAGLYSSTIDGKWGPLTDVGHVAFATSDPHRRGYNCAGFAFKTFTFLGLAATNSIYATMTKMKNCADPVKPFHYKFWMWEFDLQTLDTLTGRVTPPHRDFHTVGGQADKKGNGPSVVMSKNGPRNVTGPAPPLSWRVVNGPAPLLDNSPSPRFRWIVTNETLTCFTNPTLP